MTERLQVDRVAAIIPAYQASESVADVVGRSLEQLSHVLVVDDGSTDGSGQAAYEAGADLIVHEHNCGKGAALRTGFSHWFGRGFDAVVTLDADGQHLPEEIDKLLEASADGSDLVLGTRDHLFAEMSWLRRISNSLSSRLISIAAGTRLPDVQTGFRLYRRRLLEGVALEGDGFEAETGVVVRARRKGYRVSSTSVRMGFVDGRSTSHYRPLADSLRIARAVLRAR